MTAVLHDAGRDLLFRAARTFSAWLDHPVSDESLREQSVCRVGCAGGCDAQRNSSLQGAYFILAARAVGLDCGPMSGFDNTRVDEEFFAPGKTAAQAGCELFPSGDIRSNFLCNLGYGNRSTLVPREPRLEFAEACALL